MPIDKAGFRRRAPSRRKADVRRPLPRLRGILAELAVLALAMAEGPKKQERQIVERWLNSRPV